MAYNLIRANKVRDSMLRHMKKKYDVTFIALSLILSGLSDSKDVLTCYATGTDPMKDYVTVNRWAEDGQYTYGDTYFSVKIRPEIESLFYGICQDLALEAQVRYVPKDFFSESFDKQKTFADLAADSQCRRIDVTVIIKTPVEYNARVLSSEFTERVMLTIFRGSCKQYYIKPEYFDDLDEENIYERLYESQKYLVYHSQTLCMY